MPDLDQVLQPHAARERTAPPYPSILEGTYVKQHGDGYLRLDASSLVGPITGDSGIADGDLLVVAVAQTGVPYVIYPHG